MKQTSISIKEIARLANTSVATVSRVINQNGRFSKETEQRVLKIIEEYGYRPNALAKGLREDKTKLVGVMIPDITHSFFSRVYRAIELELYQNGYLSILCDTNESEELEMAYMEHLKDMRFSGLIYMNGNQYDAKIDCPATIYLDRYPAHPKHDNEYYFIGSDNFQGGYLAAEALIKAGRKKITIVTIDRQLVTQRLRQEGFCTYLKKQSSIPVELNILNVDRGNYLHGYEITNKILSRNIECDGIYYTSDLLAYGGLQCLRDHNIRIPQDISVVGMDDLPLSSSFNLTTIRQDMDMLGQLAARSVIDLLENKTIERQQIVPVSLVSRGTI
ncbi:MAG: LacI family DNA-binding transcriptional regulator [Lachnospiraceae bacterium]|nr:LacI family DNA-binding transcriptional regulator [Lachnospiraceae bacterium]